MDVKSFINQTCVSKKTGRLDPEALLRLAERNGIPTDHLRAVLGQPYVNSRIRMSVGNALRGRCRREEPVYDLRGRRVESLVA